jgi:hypothetical protein
VSEATELSNAAALAAEARVASASLHFRSQAGRISDRVEIFTPSRRDNCSQGHLMIGGINADGRL